MKGNFIFLSVLFSLFIISCKNEQTEQNTEKKEEQVGLKHSNCQVNILMDSLILKDSSTCFKIIPNKTSYKILSGYTKCEGDIREYSDSTQKLKNCGLNLIVENDTVKIYVTYSNIGVHDFEKITLLLIDEKKNLSYIDTSFSFNVK